MMGDAARHMPITSECLSSEGSDAHGHACSAAYTAVCNSLHVQARRDLHAQEDIQSEQKQADELAICAIVRDQQEVRGHALHCLQSPVSLRPKETT